LIEYNFNIWKIRILRPSVTFVSYSQYVISNKHYYFWKSFVILSLIHLCNNRWGLGLHDDNSNVWLRNKTIFLNIAKYRNAITGGKHEWLKSESEDLHWSFTLAAFQYSLSVLKIYNICYMHYRSLILVVNIRMQPLLHLSPFEKYWGQINYKLIKEYVPLIRPFISRTTYTIYCMIFFTKIFFNIKRFIKIMSFQVFMQIVIED